MSHPEGSFRYRLRFRRYGLRSRINSQRPHPSVCKSSAKTECAISTRHFVITQHLKRAKSCSFVHQFAVTNQQPGLYKPSRKNVEISLTLQLNGLYLQKVYLTNIVQKQKRLTNGEHNNTKQRRKPQHHCGDWRGGGWTGGTLLRDACQ